MKLVRFRTESTLTTLRTGILLDDGQVLDCSAFGEDFNEEFFGSNGLERFSNWLELHREDTFGIPFDDVEFAPPVGRPSKLICVGLNYARHAEETGAKLPDEPVLFMKATSAVTGANSALILPKGSTKTDWEVELAVVIGDRAASVSEEEAMDYVAGYAMMIDYSERSWQKERGGQWVKGKSADTFAPLGPTFVTRDEIPDPHRLSMSLSVNGEVRQNSSTADMIFGVPYLISYISQFMTLFPGDIISTGTPEGVGAGMNPQTFLKPGDVVEAKIEGLGQSRQKVVEQSV